MDPGIVVALVALLTSILSVAVSYIFNSHAVSRNEKRKIFAQAYRTIIQWEEMPYRVARRSWDEEKQLRRDFHILQENTAFYAGWIAGSSPNLSRSYNFCLDRVKKICKEPLQRAWEVDPYEREDPNCGKQFLPDIDSETLKMIKSRFITDIRCHLSPWPLPHLILVLRNRSKEL